ncbi:TatD family hydrolase [Oxalicibacterium solurbis]|uniref:TatD related DNase n=1 Tax=Oxalicibacterium solurbis TaxID=69280 RepID=A0A8J3F562_9BURK|nr:TatD family hydrolase [Oxalicibacterium solurbis]GGI53236.1 TatD related DNase [Oxalicibacterium solurbis]
MWIDTHCHLDASEFGATADAFDDVAVAARENGVGMIVVPAVARDNFSIVAELAHRHINCTYALGIHPIFVPQADEDDLQRLREGVAATIDDPRLVAIGEIGLDFFVPILTTPEMRERQEFFYSEQLKIARDFDLPVLLHVRKSQDQILKYLRRITVPGGIAHAFNGSFQQANTFIDLGFRLGFGGAMTFTRALQIRRLAAELPLDALVLETDAPDISPAWLHPQRNSPEQLPRIGQVLAELRGMPVADVAEATSRNACAAMPRLKALL